MNGFKRKHLAYAFTGFVSTLFLSFVARAYPATTLGIIIILGSSGSFMVIIKIYKILITII